MANKKIWLGILVLVFGFISCTSTPNINLTQTKMDITDPRVPDKFDDDGDVGTYYLGSWAPELPRDQQSYFFLNKRTTSNLFIDGKIMRLPASTATNGITTVTSGRLALPPGKHKLIFDYYEERKVGVRNDETIRINQNSIQLEVDMKPGFSYFIRATVSDVTDQSARASLEKYMMGYGGRYSVIIDTDYRQIGKDVPNSKVRTSRTYLVPYDSTVPPESQCFLETTEGVYIVSFNGDSVSWYGTISVPSGKNVLQLKKLKDNNIYTVTLNCRPGRRYIFQSTEKGINGRNITDDQGMTLTLATPNT